MDRLPEVVPARHPGRIIGGAAALLVLAAIAYVIGSSQHVKWEVIIPYVFTATLISGLLETIKLTVLSMVLGVSLGTVLAVMRMSQNPVLRAISSAYVWFFRATPLMVQIFFWFNIALFLPRVDLGFVSIDTNTIVTVEVAALLALVLHEAANMAEIVRGGIMSVDPGQSEAATALGLRRIQALRRVILPQAVRVIIPATGNQTIGMLKATAMVSVIGAHDLLTQAQNIYARNFLVVELLMSATIWYLVLTTVATWGQQRLEKHYSKGFDRGYGTRRRARVKDATGGPSGSGRASDREETS
ncbi:amino acid ABC transporter permease [Microbacterium sp. 22242]|uniref:amino acid ABC transporter permease n=1 Tax=Microbacterium sp. 22242 TaxID=3453896 RepID=UPI003F831046